jgi:hypothetical protein
MTPVEKYIRDYALSIGLNPDIVMRVVLSEGGAESLTNLTRQSLVGAGTGDQEQSYGPLQLNVRGGLGARALAAGIDPRDPKQAMAALKFGLDVMKREGLGAWEGWKGDPWAANAGPGTRADVPFPDEVTSSVYHFPKGSIDDARQDTPSYSHPKGSDLPGSPYDLPTPEEPYGGPESRPMPTDPANPEDKPKLVARDRYENPLLGVGKAVAKLGAQGGDRSTQIGNVPNPPMTSMAPMPSVDPAMAQRQALAMQMALARLNSGQLWPAGGMPGMGGGGIG